MATSSHQQARHDPLTGVLNRTAFDRVVRQAFSRAEGIGIPAVLVTFDAADVADASIVPGLGGDEQLRHVAALLRASVRIGDATGRIDATGFAVLLNDCDEARAAAVAQRLADSLGAHIGVAPWRPAMVDAGAWMLAARALCKASPGRGVFVMTSSESTSHDDGEAGGLYASQRRGSAPRASQYW
jgi:diguanylate cyclase (GGDEF)-like protein